MSTGNGTSMGAALIAALVAAETLPRQWPGDPRRIEIYGRVRTGADDRNRGAGCAPFRIDGTRGDWTRMRAAWEAEDVNAAMFEEWLTYDVIELDIGEGSDEWEFPGDAYRIDLT